MDKFNGLGMNLGSLSLLSDAQTRSISPENLTGEPGKGGMAIDGPAALCARDLGQGWKISPYRVVEPGHTLELADIDGPGAIQHIWLTPTGNWRFSILRIFWDNQEQPSVECPVGDFFATGWNKYAPLVSQPVCVNPGSAFNCYWEMPFRKHCRITLENIADEQMTIYWQVDYTLTDVPQEAAYFHAQFRRVNPLPYKDVYVLIDEIAGAGQYVGTYMAWGVNNSNWWGEGEIKFYIDADDLFPTICGTGTEDYFCGAYNFEVTTSEIKRYQEFCTPYAGMHQVLRPDGLYQSQTRFGMYRWHIMDPVRFRKKLQVTIQALGWRTGNRYLPLQDDIASVSYWYQTLPTAPFPPFPTKDELEII